MGISIGFLDTIQPSQNVLFLMENIPKNFLVLNGYFSFKEGDCLGKVKTRIKGVLDYQRKGRMGSPHGFYLKRLERVWIFSIEVDKKWGVVRVGSR